MRTSGGEHCAAIGCRNNRLKKKCMSFFRFPKNETRSKKWVENTGRQNLLNVSCDRLNKCYVLCAEHFDDSQFNNRELKNRLKWNAEPTVFAVSNQPPLQSLKTKPRTSQTYQPVSKRRWMNIERAITDGHLEQAVISYGETPRQPRLPNKPLLPYMRYSRKVSRSVWNSVHANNQNLKLWEIGAVIGQMWKELSNEEKQQYTDEYESEKIQYAEALKVYRDSPAYQSWITAKEMVDLDVKPAKAKRSKVPRPPVQRRVIVIQPIEEEEGAPPSPVEQRVIVIQPREEEDLDDGLSAKYIAASGYQYNHNNLNNEIFSEAVVPDIRTIINETRMTVLKKEKLLPEDESTVCFDMTLYACGFCDEMFQIKKEFMEHCERHYCENRQTDTLLDLFEICLSV